MFYFSSPVTNLLPPLLSLLSFFIIFNNVVNVFFNFPAQKVNYQWTEIQQLLYVDVITHVIHILKPFALI